MLRPLLFITMTVRRPPNPCAECPSVQVCLVPSLKVSGVFEVTCDDKTATRMQWCAGASNFRYQKDRCQNGLFSM